MFKLSKVAATLWKETATFDIMLQTVLLRKVISGV